MGKIEKLENIMKQICEEQVFQESADITLGKNPARVYFTFAEERTEKILEIAGKYGLQRDKSKPIYENNKVTLRFKLKSVRKEE